MRRSPLSIGVAWWAREIARVRLAMFLDRSPMRSSSPEIFIALAIWRRSSAMGWRRAIMPMANSSTSRSSAVDRLVLGDGGLGHATGPAPRWPRRRAPAARPRACPFRAILASSTSSSAVNDFTRWSCSVIVASVSAKPAGDVILGARVARRGEHRRWFRRTPRVRPDT